MDGDADNEDKEEELFGQFIPSCLAPNLATDPGSTSESVLGPPGVRGGIPLGG